MRFGVREICNVVFKARTARTIGATSFPAGAPVLYFDSLKTSTMEQAVTTVYAQGGRGNTRLVAWEGEKTLTFTMEDALISEMGLAILAGAKLYDAGVNDNETGAAKYNTLVVHVTENVKVKENNKIELTREVASSQPMYALKLDKDTGEIVGSPVKVEDETITGAMVGDSYLIDYYTEVKENAKQIDIEPETFGGNFYIEADTLFRDTNGDDHAAQFIIPNGKIQSNFTLSMASSGDPSTFTFTVDAFPGYVNGDTSKKVLSAIQILGGKETGYFNDAAGDIDTAITGTEIGE